MELKNYTRVIGKWLWLIVLAALLAAVSSYLAVRSVPRIYQTKTTVMVGRFIQDLDPNTTDFYTGQQLAQTYVQLVQREPVLQGALDSLGMDDQMGWNRLANKVSVRLVAGTQLIEIYVSDIYPERARLLADAIAQELVRQSPSNPSSDQSDRRLFAEEQMTELEDKIARTKTEVEDLKVELDAAISARQISNLQSQINTLQDKISTWQSTYTQFLMYLEGGEVNYITIVEQAQIPYVPISPNVSMNVMMAVFTAVAMALGAAFLIEYIDDTIKTPEDIERTVPLITLGAIVRIVDEERSQPPVSARTPRAQVVEAYRALRTNLQFSMVEKPIQSLVVTSPNPVEGKSTTVANLAVVMAQSGMSTILVDADLRRPTLHRKFNLPNAGLTTALLAEQGQSVREFLQETSVENLRVLTSGSIPPNPAELMVSSRMRQLIKTLEEEADIVLFDTPPALAVADAAILAAQIGGIVLVVDAGRTRRNLLKRAVESLERTGTPILGVVINRLTSRTGGYYYYQYYQQYYSSNGRKQKEGLMSKIPFIRMLRDRTVEDWKTTTDQSREK